MIEIGGGSSYFTRGSERHSESARCAVCRAAKVIDTRSRHTAAQITTDQSDVQDRIMPGPSRLVGRRRLEPLIALTPETGLNMSGFHRRRLQEAT